MKIAEKVKTLHLEFLIQECIKQNFAFAVYRLPETAQKIFLLSTNKNALQHKIDFEQCKSGFVMAAFNTEALKPYFISADFLLHISSENNVEIPLDFPILNNYLYDFEEKSSKISFNLEPENESNYITKANLAIEALQNKSCNKVVLSRKKLLATFESLNYTELLNKLCDNYSSAFVSMVNIPWQNQIWIGATPETLVSQNNIGDFKTVALAGTQNGIAADGSKIKTKAALWSQKEIEEQAIVGRYIINCLKQIRVREFTEEGPKTITAGNLLHLCSYYTVKTNEIEYENFSSAMLEMLHPTPAVCGMPKKEALDIISELEEYDREFYSGYLGPINVENESNLFVNLRVMKIENNSIYAYAGGGITRDSDSHKEWLETELKLKTIQSAFA